MLKKIKNWFKYRFTKKDIVPAKAVPTIPSTSVKTTTPDEVKEQTLQDDLKRKREQRARMKEVRGRGTRAERRREWRNSWAKFRTRV